LRKNCIVREADCSTNSRRDSKSEGGLFSSFFQTVCCCRNSGCISVIFCFHPANEVLLDSADLKMESETLRVQLQAYVQMLSDLLLIFLLAQRPAEGRFSRKGVDSGTQVPSGVDGKVQ